MASPQKENGYTPISNELYDQIRLWKFSVYERNIVDFIMRKTYGWNKKEDKISLSQFTESTKIKTAHVCRTLKILIAQNIIFKKKVGQINIYGIQKDYTLWNKPKKGTRSHHVKKGGVPPQGVPVGVMGGVPLGGDTKDTITKDNLYINTHMDFEAYCKLIKAFAPVNPMWRMFKDKQNQQDAMERLVEVFGYDDILHVINLLQNFAGKVGFPIITSPQELEWNIAKLVQAVKREEGFAKIREESAKKQIKPKGKKII